MRKFIYGLIPLFILGMSLSVEAQVTYSGNSNTGFGGLIGNSSMEFDDDGTTITVTFTKGAGDFNDAMVIYLFTGADGRNVIDGEVNDQGDGLRRAISSVGVDGQNASDITFLEGFEASHAIAIETGFGGLWEIPTSGTVGDDELGFVSAVNSTLTSNDQASFTFEFDFDDIGLEAGQSFGFVATYLNAGNGFLSNEGYGAGLPGGNPGADAVTFTSYFEYPSGDEITAPPVPAPGQVVLSAPADNSMNLLPNIVFSWEEEADATSYEIEIARDAAFEDVVVNADGIGSTSTTRFVPLDGSYYWRVRGFNTGGAGPWSNAWEFTTQEVDYLGSMGDGASFGGPVGNSGMTWEMDLSTVNVTFYKGTGGFNDFFVIYLSTGVDTPNNSEQYAGRAVIDGDVNDTADDGRRAVSAAGTNASVITFPDGFEATHAIVISTGIGNLFEFPDTEDPIGFGDLVFRSEVNSTLSSSGDETFTFSFDLNDLFEDGRPVTELDFVAVYLNPTNDDGFHSNEGYGGVFPEDNIGDGDFTFDDNSELSFDVPFRFTTLDNGKGWYVFAPNTTSTLRNLEVQNMVQGVSGGTWEQSSFPNIYVQYSGLVWDFEGFDGIPALNLPAIPQLIEGWPVPDSIERVAEPGIAFSWYLFDGSRPDVDDDKPLPMDLIQVGEPFTGSQAIELHAFGNFLDACPDIDVAGDDNLFVPPPYAGNTIIQNQLISNMQAICDGEPDQIQDANNFNIFGNPYAEELDLSGFGTWGVGGDVQNSVFSYNNETRDWELVTELGVAKGAIFENATETPAQQLQIQPVFSRGNGIAGNTRTINLELTGSAGDQAVVNRNTIISFHEDAVIGWDRWSATRVMPLSNTYAVLNMIGERKGRDVAQARTSLPFDLDEEYSIPIAIKAQNTDKQFTINVTDFDNIPSDWQIVLTDHHTGTSKTLDHNASYSFEAESATSTQSVEEEARNPEIRAVKATGLEQRFTLTIIPGVTTSVGNELPAELALKQNYPNPFNPTTLIEYALPESADVRLEVFNMLGQRVAVLENGRVAAGVHTVTFDAGALSSGMYIYRLEAGSVVKTKKMMLVK